MKESGGLERRIGTFQAITINMSQMMGPAHLSRFHLF